MGLDDFNIAPDNHGGRKPKEEREDSETIRHETAFTLSRDTEEYWQEVYDRYVFLGEPDKEEIMDICAYTACLPRTVKKKLTEYEIYEFEGYDKHYDPFYEDSTPTFGSGSSDDEDSSGLSGLVNDAK